MSTSPGNGEGVPRWRDEVEILAVVCFGRGTVFTSGRLENKKERRGRGGEGGRGGRLRAILVSAIKYDYKKNKY